MKQLRRASVFKAFTLVELLVVVAIVVILAGIVLSVTVAAKGTAHRTGCLSNLHQVGIGVSLYLADSDNRFPRSVNKVEILDPRVELGNRGRARDGYPTHPEVYRPYLKTLEVLRCPQDSGGGIRQIDAHGPLHAVNGGSSYIFATLLDDQDPFSWPNPAKHPYASDGAKHWHAPETKEEVGTPGRANQLYYDWHVSTHGFASVSWFREYAD